MSRLSDRAFEILKSEVQRRTAQDPAGDVLRDLALRRLERLKTQAGAPYTAAELRELLQDLFPDFSDKVLQAADRANRGRSPGNPFRGVVGLAVGIAAIAGGLWVLNLPYPPIRYPVSRVAPILLLPSFMSMDHNYRQAISLVEQSDQLINQATAPPDLELGETKVKAAQKHLDALPVWFLGYYPQFYCSWFQCGWRFTVDEFEQARKLVARADARLFQEKNAQTQLNQADSKASEAKQSYRTAADAASQSAAIAQWQDAIDKLHEVPPQTLAGRMVQPKLAAYERDFQQVVGLSGRTTRAGNLIGAAEEFAHIARKSSTGTAHTVAEWQEIQQQWETAIARLQQIDDQSPDYQQAQKLLAEYTEALAHTRIRLKAEQESVQTFETAQAATQALLATLPSDQRAIDYNRLTNEMQAIVNQLRKVSPGTTVYAEAQQLKQSAQNKLKQLQN